MEKTEKKFKNYEKNYRWFITCWPYRGLFKR